MESTTCHGANRIWKRLDSRTKLTSRAHRTHTGTHYLLPFQRADLTHIVDRNSWILAEHATCIVYNELVEILEERGDELPHALVEIWFDWCLSYGADSEVRRVLSVARS